MVDVRKNTIELEVNGARYNQFKEASITRSLDSIGGSFEFVIANAKISELPVKLNDNATVYINDRFTLNGYINKLTPSYSISEHSVNIAGFDRTIDITQSDISANAEYNGPISLKQLIEKVLSDNGINDIEVLDEASGTVRLLGVDAPFIIGFAKGEKTAGKTGENLFSYIDRISRKKQCLLSTDGVGNIVIYRSSGNDIGGEIVNIFDSNANKFIKSASSTFDYNKRFRTVIVRSQDNNGTDKQGSATDSGAREGRTKVIVSDLQLDTQSCQEMAVWEVNKRRSDSKIYNCTLQGFWATKDRIWEPNQIINIHDDYADIKSKMLLRDVTYRISEQSGYTTDLTFVSPDSYSLQASDPNIKENKIGDDSIL